jgi:hypothetical protein
MRHFTFGVLPVERMYRVALLRSLDGKVSAILGYIIQARCRGDYPHGFP